MDIREAKEKDIDKIAKLYNLLATDYAIKYHKIWEEIDNPGPIAIKDYLNSSKCKLFVAEEDNNIMGFIATEFDSHPSTYKFNKTLNINDLSIDPKYQRKGVGTALINRVKQYAKDNGIKYVTLEVAVENESAKNCYLKNDFKSASEKMVYEVTD